MSHLPRDANGKLPAFTFPGGYSILYLCKDGGTVCADCANSDDFTAEDDSSGQEVNEQLQWILTDAFVRWEGPTEYCDHCNKALESEYGDPESL